MIVCSKELVANTLAFLKDAGRRHNECVVLWLGRPSGNQINIVECYRPHQIAKFDLFRIPPEGMTALQAKLRAGRLMVAAQVHSHPNVAFHSEADNAWAIVRHEGALSLVVPDFATHTEVGHFLDDTKVFQFSSGALWDEVPKSVVERTCLQIS